MAELCAWPEPPLLDPRLAGGQGALGVGPVLFILFWSITRSFSKSFQILRTICVQILASFGAA